MDLHHWPLNLFRGKTSSPESGLPSPASGHIKREPRDGGYLSLWSSTAYQPLMAVP